MLKTVGNLSSRNGDQTIVDGNLVVGTDGKGIDFSATPGTGTSELLDDYEEGTWSPSVYSGTGTLTTVSGQAGNYTKIGRQVTVLCQFVIDTNGTGGTYVAITNLPFAPSGTTPGYGAVPAQGKGLFANFATGFGIILRFADGTYPGADGNSFFVGLTYNV